MPKIAYTTHRFKPESMATIQQANDIIEQYSAQGIRLTLRALFYRFVARGALDNKQTEYSRLGGLISDARLAGYVDWEAIVDETRNLRHLAHWDSPAQIIGAAHAGFRHDKWADQPTRVELWIEKDAALGVVSGICDQLDVPYFSCRGYTSQSGMWEAAQRINGYLEAGQMVVVLHIGDHDPSGIDMSRDIEDRLRLFTYENPNLSIQRIALTMFQIKQYDPPPNPAKFTDSRAAGYVALHGASSWELDALDPTVVRDLIRGRVLRNRDNDIWDTSRERERTEKRLLAETSKRWNDVVAMLRDDED